MLLAEEVTGRMLSDAQQKVFLTVSQFFGDVTLQITHPGEALDPLETSSLTEEDTQDLYRGRILNAYRGIDSLLTMLRVSLNVVGDIAATTAVAASENILDREIYSNERTAYS